MAKQNKAISHYFRHLNEGALLLTTKLIISFFGLVKPERTHLSVNADIKKAVKFGTSVTFNCTAESHPSVDQYRFYRDQEFLGSNTSGVYHVELQRSGLYSCIAVNSAGSGQNATLYISVHGKTYPRDNHLIHSFSPPRKRSH